MKLSELSNQELELAISFYVQEIEDMNYILNGLGVIADDHRKYLECKIEKYGIAKTCILTVLNQRNDK